VFIITDFDRSYPTIFKEFFKNELYHQKCILHLNKLIVKEYSRNCSLEMELLKYEYLNIFYNREREIRYLKFLIDWRNNNVDKKDHNKWDKDGKKKFRSYLRDLEKFRRRRKENLEMWSYNEAVNLYNGLVEKYDDLPEFAQKRLYMIHENWECLNIFRYFDNAPATNNKIENYYSTSLKTDKKKKYRSDKGIQNQMKLSQLKVAGMLDFGEITILDVFKKFTPFHLKFSDYG